MSADLPASFSLSKYQPAKPGMGGGGCGGAHTKNPTLVTERIPSCSEKPLFTPQAKEARQERKQEQVAGWAHHLHNEQIGSAGAMGMQGGWNGEKKRNFFFLTLEGLGYTWQCALHLGQNHLEKGDWQSHWVAQHGMDQDGGRSSQLMSPDRQSFWVA